MNELLKNLGVIVLLIGVIILAVPAINGGLSNTILLTGLGVIIRVISVISLITRDSVNTHLQIKNDRS